MAGALSRKHEIQGWNWWPGGALEGGLVQPALIFPCLSWHGLSLAWPVVRRCRVPQVLRKTLAAKSQGSLLTLVRSETG